MQPGDVPFPRLRADVRLEEGSDGAGALFDPVLGPVLGRRLKLDARGLLLAKCLRSEFEADRLPGAIATRIASTPETVIAIGDKLASLDLLATERAARRVADKTALIAVKAAPDRHLRVLPGAHFGCTMCGSCCGGHNIGPVSPEILDGLEAHLPELEATIRSARRIDKDLFFVLPGERATPGQDVMCHASGGSCVFLDDTGKCRIHARVSGEAKPLPCRIFPWELVATPSGVRVAVQRECRDFVRATDSDKPSLELAHAELAALVRAIPELPAAKITPKLHGSELSSWSAWEALESRLFEIANAHASRDAVATFIALRGALGVDRTDAVVASDSSFAQWRDRLSSMLSQMLGAAPPPNERMWIRVDGLRLLMTALSAAEGWPLARALAPLEEAEAAFFRAHLRHSLWSTTLLRATSVEAGLGRLVAEWTLARMVALVRAREVKRFHVILQDLQDALAVVSFLFRHDDLVPLLAELDALTVAVFVDQLDTLTGAPDAGPADRRLELVKF